MNFTKFINESKNWKNGKEIGEKLTNDVMNSISNTIDSWIKKNIGVKGVA